MRSEDRDPTVTYKSQLVSSDTDNKARYAELKEDWQGKVLLYLTGVQQSLSVFVYAASEACESNLVIIF